MEQEYEEINLIDYVKVIIKRKKIIAIIFFLAVIIAGVLSFVLPKVYKIDTTLSVGKIENPEAKTEEERVVLVEDPLQVKQKIDNDVYGILIREKLSISEAEYPKITTENPKETNLITLKINSDKIQQAQDILTEINNAIVSEHQDKIKNRLDLVDKNIKSTEEKIKLTESNIKSTENKILPIDNDIGRIESKIKSVEEEKNNLEAKIDALQKVPNYQQDPGTQFALFSAKEKLAGKKQEIESLFMEINTLKKQKDDLAIQINVLKAEIESLNSGINSLKESKSYIKETRIIKMPAVSERQVSPRPVLYMAIAMALGLFAGIFMAFGKEWWENNKKSM